MMDTILKKEIIEKAQFPYGKRDVQYQSLDGMSGIRDMHHRFEIMGFPDSFEGETVIDIGCSIGAICFEAKKRGAKRVVGIDYRKETIEVGKKLAKEYGLDVELYAFDINDGLGKLKTIIGDDKFDHTFALAIWTHCDKNKLSNIINFYTDKLCWFEGHNVSTYGDTRDKIENSLSNLLKFSHYEYLGETKDRGLRQTYKFSNLPRVDISNRKEYVYFDESTYWTVKESNYNYKNKLPGGKHLMGQNSYSDKKEYNYQGKYSSFVANTNDDFGYKIFNFSSVKNLSEKRKSAEDIFKIQKMLSDNGFAPKPYEIICCYDDKTFHYAIKMENIKGKFVEPSKEWVEKLVEFCDRNGLDRNDWSLKEDCVVKNCIERDGNIYLVDIDWKCCSFWMNNKLDEWELK